jgi:hypothetical protein
MSDQVPKRIFLFQKDVTAPEVCAYLIEVKMKKTLMAVALLQVLVRASAAAPIPTDCSLCLGVVADMKIAPLSPVLLLVLTTRAGLPDAARYVADLPIAARKKTSVLVSYRLDGTGQPLDQIEENTRAIIDWAQRNGPLDAIGADLQGAPADQRAYAIKRLSVTAQGLGIASTIMARASTTADLGPLYEAGAQAYFDQLVVDGSAVADFSEWLTANDPVKKIIAVVTPQAPNPFFDLASALAHGASRAYISQANTAEILTAVSNADRALGGDYAFDASSRAQMLDAKGQPISEQVLAFVRGEDLRTIVVPQGAAPAGAIVSLRGTDLANPQRIDARGITKITDNGVKGGNFLVGLQPATGPFVLSVEHTDRPDATVSKEAIDVNTKRGITVDEIIRNHQAYRSYGESVQPRYVATNTTKLRFVIAEGGESVESTIEGDYFSEPGGKSDWVWQNFYINGVKWKYGRIPELPLIQPEKVTQLPLDIHLTNEYRYQLIRETDVDGYHTYEVRFEPPPKAPANLPLYRGTVWIDAHTFARIRISMVQLNLSGEVLSNEERVDFVPFATASYTPLTAAQVSTTSPRDMVWLPGSVTAQQVVSAAGRANVILRETTFSSFRINPPDYDRLHQEDSASDARMVRETDTGMKYLEKRADGERVVKEGFDQARLFLLGGIHHDAGLQFPVIPLGGIDYFNFNTGNTGIQTNVFFAGVIVAANATNPDFHHTRINVGADFSGIAIPFDNSIFRNGHESKGEAVKTLPVSLTLRAGHPFLQFGKVDFSLGLSHANYQRSPDTAPGFEVPADTFIIDPSIDASYSRHGYTLGGFFDYSHRTNWRPWGNLAEYNSNQQSFTDWGGSFGKSFYLPKFQRIGVEVDYLDGQHLDRFSKYELGFFGSQRIHGFQSGSVRAEKATLGHLSYGFVFSQQFRLETFYDYGLLDDRASSLHHEPFQGVGVGGQTIGPYGTILRLDLGKSVGRNKQGGFVANVVFLKLFG